MTNEIGKLVVKIGHQFSDIGLLELALTHRSRGSKNYERLEFLGDSVLNFLVAEHLFSTFQSSPEGVLTRLRANLVRRETLAVVARELDLGQYIRLGEGELKSGGHRRESILADTLEAVIGALYLDGGLHTAKQFVFRFFKQQFEQVNPDDVQRDSKTRLQEYLQKHSHDLPVYEIINTQGPAHQRHFTVHCSIGHVDEVFVGEGASRRTAEQQAAAQALARFESNGE